jgi:hypothetical protein
MSVGSWVIGFRQWEVKMATAFSKALGSGLRFTGMTPLGIGKGFNLLFGLTDATQTAQLCVGDEDNRVLITGTTPASREAAVLDAIDTYGKWGEDIQLWMIARKDGETTARTNPVTFRTHVKPYYGKLTISDIAKDDPAMTYPGNGYGRVLSPLINDRYYFKYASSFETDNTKRGFDCTSFPMALFSIRYLPPPGYGKQLADAAGATICDYEQKKSADLEKEFKENTTPLGLYILFSEGHVLLYNSDINMLYEFTYGGFKSTPAGLREMTAKHNLWWMRKLPETYRAQFA